MTDVDVGQSQRELAGARSGCGLGARAPLPERRPPGRAFGDQEHGGGAVAGHPAEQGQDHYRGMLNHCSVARPKPDQERKGGPGYRD